jgi:hypothetical protein
MTEKFDAVAKDVSPRDAQKGGQGAVSASHPEALLRQDARRASDSAPRPREVTQGLTSDQIALLCEVEARDSSKFSDDKKHTLDRLRSEGYIAPTGILPNSGFSLTAKGIDFLGKRGAGINEA